MKDWKHVDWTEIESEFKNQTGPRGPTMLEAACFAKRTGCKRIVETGTYRGPDNRDGFSTVLFGILAAHIGAEFFSIDVSSKHLELSKAICKEWSIKVSHVQCDSVVWLNRQFDSIGLLYLDSVDYDFGCPGIAQQHNLAEMKAALPHMAEDAMVLFDDHGYPGGGKPFLTIPWLKDHGWRVVLEGELQIVMANQA